MGAGRLGAVLTRGPFRRFWLGFTISALGDAMTLVALIWLVYSATHSPQAIGLLLLCYTGPVLVGGILAGWLLDRFDRPTLMIVDSLIRGAAIGSIPMVEVTGHLAMWQVYGAATVYGLLFMITLAGGPSLVPSLVPPEYLSSANALESLSFTSSGVLGPPLAGLIISWSRPSVVLALDALSYGAFAIALIRLPVPSEPAVEDATSLGSGLYDAFKLVITNQVLLTTTSMFMAFNMGFGFLSVGLPALSARLHGGARLYGLFLGAMASGEVLGSVAAGSPSTPWRLGSLICVSQTVAGASIALMLAEPNQWWWIALCLATLGVVSAPLTIWAQTLRMAIIPPNMRGRTFALLRTLMQGTGPLASAMGGLMLPLISLTTLIGMSAALVGIPGILGSTREKVRCADQASGRRQAAVK